MFAPLWLGTKKPRLLRGGAKIAEMREGVSSALGLGGRRIFREGSNGQQDGRNDHTGIRHIERRPGIEGTEAEVKAEEIHHITVEEAVGQVAKDASHQKGHGGAAQNSRKSPLLVHPNDEGQGRERNGPEGVVRILSAVEHAKGHAGIRRVMQPEDAGDDFLLGLMKDKMLHNP